ncbi:NAD(P)-dependent oxidoreductase [Paractinoplanes aksuensis]|nr:NAD(P)-dependent oxidoreductase [Actinoplanes aksuensis]
MTAHDSRTTVRRSYRGRMTTVTTVGVVGLGIMGSAISGHLLDAGFDVTGTDVSDDAMREFRGRPAADLATLARESSVVITSLPSAEAALQVCAELASEGLVVVDTSTLSLAVKEKCRALVASAGGELLDCPISGTGAQAKVRDLVVLGSGDEAAFATARPVLEAFARSVRHLGPFGDGTRMKLVANLLVSIHNASTAEAFALGVAAGLDPTVLYETVRDGAGGSVIFDKRGPLMVRRSYKPATARVSMFLKDVALVQELADSVGVRTPVLDATLPLYERAAESGWADADAAALLEVLEEKR